MPVYIVMLYCRPRLYNVPVRPLNDGQRKYVARNNRIRRVTLDAWEVTDPNMCWLAIWMAYREKPIVPELTAPTLPQEWDDLRRWAKQYVKRHSHHSKTNPYWELATMSMDKMVQTVHCVDDPSNTVIWPHSSPPPTSLADRAACVMMLSPQIDRIALIPCPVVDYIYTLVWATDNKP